MSIGCAWSRFTKAAVLTGAMALLVAPPLFAEEPASEAPLAAPDAGASTEPDVPSDAGVPPLEATPAPSVAPVAPPQPSPKPVACRRKDPLARVDAFLFDVPDLDKLAAAEDDGDPKRAVLATIDTKAIARPAFRTLLETELRRLKLEYGTESGAKWADASRISASDAEHAGADGQKCFDFLLLPQIRRKEAAWDGDELDLDVEISIAVFERTADGSEWETRQSARWRSSIPRSSSTPWSGRRLAITIAARSGRRWLSAETSPWEWEPRSSGRARRS
ncbi:MAG: hypothetical protein IT377_25620 [Polyangiaceae bacterium]|nr:hypothetical protein [Polyangiaceae bacterium]